MKQDASSGEVPNWTTPADIRARVAREWTRGRLLAATVTQEPLFPWRIALRGPNATELSARFAAAREWTRALAEAARTEDRGGYRLEYRTVEHRQLGRNDVPVAAWIDDASDALALIGKRRDAERFEQLVEETRRDCPALVAWLAKRPLAALEHADDWPRFIGIVRWFEAHPRPDIYLRQIDIAGVHSKFIERHKGLLAELLDLALPETAVDRAHGAARFEARYGLREKPVTVRLRFLDPAVTIRPRWRGESATDLALTDVTLTDVTLTSAEFAALTPPVERVLITENEINFLAFPSSDRSLVLFGAGYGFDALAEARWLGDRAIHYWGDIDTHGFAILDQLRARLPHAQSLLMDRATLLAHRAHWTHESKPTNRALARLNADEAALYDDLRGDRLGKAVRLEQERVGFEAVRRAVEGL